MLSLVTALLTLTLNDRLCVATWREIFGTAAQQEQAWEQFHEASKTSRYDPLPPTKVILEQMAMYWESLPYEGYPCTTLPTTRAPLNCTLEQAISRRTTARSLAPTPLNLEQLATLLHSAYGIVRDNVGTVFPRPFRTVPSGGALYPLELYLHSTQLEGLQPGLQHYNPSKNELRLLREGDESRALASALVQPNLALEASLMIFITAVFERSTFKYGDRGYRFVLIEAGHVAQNIALAGVGLGLGVVTIGGFLDRQIDDILRIDGLTHSTIYMVGLGRSADANVDATTQENVEERGFVVRPDLGV
jgi:SagB-type dehydrogenase family enzyme